MTCTCLNISSRRFCSIIFPKTEVKFTSLLFSGSSFLPFLKTGVIIPLFHSLWTFYLITILSEYDKESFVNHISQILQDLGCTSLSLINLHTFSFISNLECDLLLQWERFCFSINCLEFQGCERHGKPNIQWRLRQRTWVSQPSPYLLLPVLPFQLSEGEHFPCPFSFEQSICRISCSFSHPLPSAVLSVLCVSGLLYTSRKCKCNYNKLFSRNFPHIVQR